MKVLQLIPSIEAGGAELFISRLSIGLARVGIDTCLHVSCGARDVRGQVEIDKLKKAGVNVITSSSKSVRSIDNLTICLNLIKKFNPNIIQANLYSAEFWAIATKLCSRKSQCAYVHRLANSNLYSDRNKLIINYLYSQFDGCVACSEVVEKQYLQSFSKKIDCIETIENGVELADLPTTDSLIIRKKFREKYLIPESAFVFLNIGRMGSTKSENLNNNQKGQDIAIRSFAQAFNGNSQYKLLLIGDGFLRNSLKSLARDLQLEDQILFLEQQADVREVLLAADALLFPSRYEGIPNVLLEAGSFGLPVITSDIPEIKLIKYSEYWIRCASENIAEFADAQKKMVNNLEQYKQHAFLNSTNFIHHYSMQACVRKYIDYYNKMIAKLS